jgi:AAA15 family ATPase/GTPase
LPTLWKGIAEAASQLDIQVFATTHSKECIEAALEVFSEREPYDLRIIQLDRVKAGIVGRVLDQPLIEAGVEANIEMR